MTLPRRSVSPPGQVIVGVDGSPNSMAALRRALDRAAEHASES